MSEPSPLDPPPASYADAVAELESILTEMEDAGVDVDVLAARVTRAAALIDWCRDRLVVARAAIEEATSELD